MNLMNIISKIVAIVFILVASNQIHAQNSSRSLIAVEDYLDKLMNLESAGGNLFCKSENDGKHIRFENCKEFSILREQGCFGYTTIEIKQEANYRKLCEEISVVKQGQTVATNYFDLSSPDWWKALPAEIIPMPAGIYSDESWNIAETELAKLVNGKLLGDIVTKKQMVKNGVFSLILDTDKDECGEILDLLEFSPVLLADFDNDGVAELLIKGFRIDTSILAFLDQAIV